MEEKQPAQEAQSQPEKEKSKSGANIVLILLLVIALIGVGFLAFQNHQLTGDLERQVGKTEKFEEDKENVTKLLEDMLVQYDTLTTENEQLQAEIDGHKQQIMDLMEQVEKAKETEWLAYKYRKEAETLREIMKGYVVTIDSLNTLNQTLTAEKLVLEEELGTVTDEKNELATLSEDLEGQIAKGSVLHTTAISSEAIRVRSNGKQVSTTKADRTEMIKTCFSLGENRITKAGAKNLYLRIISPDGKVLSASDGNNRFEFDGVQGEYSVKRDVNYQNVPMDVCMFWTVNEEIGTGQYIVEVYESGSNIGEVSFDLK